MSNAEGVFGNRTAHQLKYIAWELTRKRNSSDDEKFTNVLSEAQVDLNPHQVDAALFAFRSPLSNGAILADDVGEKKFVEDLKKYYTDNPSSFDGVELYLLRNKSRKGIGFFEANNFYPDFILWIIKGEQQYVTFVDPKGIIISNTEHRHVEFWDKEEHEIEHFNAHHIYFQNEQEGSYIKMMLRKIVESEKR